MQYLIPAFQNVSCSQIWTPAVQFLQKLVSGLLPAGQGQGRGEECSRGYVERWREHDGKFYTGLEPTSLFPAPLGRTCLSQSRTFNGFLCTSASSSDLAPLPSYVSYSLRMTSVVSKCTAVIHCNILCCSLWCYGFRLILFLFCHFSRPQEAWRQTLLCLLSSLSTYLIRSLSVSNWTIYASALQTLKCHLHVIHHHLIPKTPREIFFLLWLFSCYIWQNEHFGAGSCPSSNNL